MDNHKKRRDEIKRKIRKLKKMEIQIRFGRDGYRSNTHLIWNDFFEQRASEKTTGVKYPLEKLVLMNRDEYKKVVDEFFYYVYYQGYKDNALMDVHILDPSLLARLGLPPGADSADVKKRFRALAKQYHPDTGGDAKQFNELMEHYQQLMKPEKLQTKNEYNSYDFE